MVMGIGMIIMIKLCSSESLESSGLYPVQASIISMSIITTIIVIIIRLTGVYTNLLKLVESAAGLDDLRPVVNGSYACAKYYIAVYVNCTGVALYFGIYMIYIFERTDE